MIKVFVLLLSIIVTGCGSTAPLHTIRAEKKPYMEKTVSIPIKEIKRNLLNNRINNSSLFNIYENADRNMITLARQDMIRGETMCFIDFIESGEETKIVVYNYVCARDTIEEEINYAIKE